MSVEYFLPPEMSVMKGLKVIPFTHAVTNSAAAISATDYECSGVLIQSSNLDDSNGSVTDKVFVSMLNPAGTAIKAYELVQGQTIYVICENTSEVKVVTQSGTGWVRGFIVQVPTA